MPAGILQDQQVAHGAFGIHVIDGGAGRPGQVHYRAHALSVGAQAADQRMPGLAQDSGSFRNRCVQRDLLAIDARTAGLENPFEKSDAPAAAVFNYFQCAAAVAVDDQIVAQQTAAWTGDALNVAGRAC